MELQNWFLELHNGFMELLNFGAWVLPPLTPNWQEKESAMYIYIYLYTHIHTNTHIYIYIYIVVVNLWHRQATFESKGDQLSSSAECRIRTWKSQDTYSPADSMPTHKPTELSWIKLKTWTQQPVPIWFIPLDFTAVWLSHLALAIYTFVVVNFDALAQASDIRI